MREKRKDVRIRLWRRKLKHHGQWKSATFHEMLADVCGGEPRYTRTAALAIETMVLGRMTVETSSSRWRFDRALAEVYQGSSRGRRTSLLDELLEKGHQDAKRDLPMTEEMRRAILISETAQTREEA